MQKKVILTLLTLGLSLQMLAQGTVNTRKYRYSDFTDKVTKVVLSGDELLQSALQEEVVNGWTVSAFEMCTLQEFETLKTQDSYYFLLVAEILHKGEEAPGLQYLMLVKGGPEASEGLSAMDEIISLPVAATGGGSGRELVYMGALVRAVQDFTLAALESEKSAYRKADWFNDRFARYAKMKQLYLAEEDLVPSVTPVQLQGLGSDTYVLPADEVDATFLAEPFQTLVSYVVAPEEPSKGAYCYKYLIEADSKEVYYLEKHKITSSKGAGFLPGDIKAMGKKR